jgi:hypothetical protein
LRRNFQIQFKFDPNSWPASKDESGLILTNKTIDTPKIESNLKIYFDVSTKL